MAKLSDEWWTAPAQAENGNVILVTGRNDMERIIARGKLVYRVEVSWTYSPDAQGMPQFADSRVMQDVTDALATTFATDDIAVMTGIYTGDSRRDWVFYTKSLPLFQTYFNRALAGFEMLPLEFHAEHDPDWEEYRIMKENEVTGSD